MSDSKKIEPNVQVIENASPDDIQAGDHLIWERTHTDRGVTFLDRRECTAQHCNPDGEWWTEGLAWIWWGTAEGGTLTIRRTTPTDD